MAQRISALTRCLVVALIFFSLHATAQTFSPNQASYWLHPDNVLFLDSVTIGNYNVLSKSDTPLQETLQKVGASHSGTLFMVLKTDSAAPDSMLMRMGNIQLYNDSAKIANTTTSLSGNLLGGENIVRLSYYFLKKHGISQKVQLSPHVHIAELLYFDKVLDTIEIRKTETYLALKYSINITENQVKKLRDYIDGEESKMWCHKRDGNFDTEVMALGRVDSLDFYQTNTFTSDSRSVQLSLDTNTHVGAMPPFDIPDNSKLILSKSSASPIPANCGAAVGERAWKIRYEDWSAEYPYFYITLDTIIEGDALPVLSNGSFDSTLTVRYTAGKTQLKVPVIQEVSHSWYLKWGQPEQACPESCKYDIIPCVNDKLARISVFIPEEHLPANVELTSIDDAYTTQHFAERGQVRIEYIPNGQYILKVSNQEENLLDKVILIEGCTGDFNAPLLDDNNPYSYADASSPFDSVSQASNPTNGVTQSTYKPIQITSGNGWADGGIDNNTFEFGITAYPNPSTVGGLVNFHFLGLNDIVFDVEFLDKGGNLIHRQRFQPTAEKPSFDHQFNIDGTYIVRFRSAIHNDIIQVVVN